MLWWESNYDSKGISTEKYISKRALSIVSLSLWHAYIYIYLHIEALFTYIYLPPHWNATLMGVALSISLYICT